MKILFTGSSSFTGLWFISELVGAGHDVLATFRGHQDSYSGVRLQRVNQVRSLCQTEFECPFGSSRFVELIRAAARWDVLAHHAATVGDYKHPGFNVQDAVENNTRNLPVVLDAMTDTSCNTLVLTATVFEPNEGVGEHPLRAFSPYGLSKGLTSEYFKYFCLAHEVKLGRFVVPNPFGPYEEQRFTTYLIRNWMQGITPTVSFPDYVRDYIHVSLLSLHYRMFVEETGSCDEPYRKCAPNGYIESNSAFCTRMSRELASRLKVECNFVLEKQNEFLEPRVRMNDGLGASSSLKWDEARAWDELAECYAEQSASWLAIHKI